MSYDHWKQTEPDANDPGRLRDEQEREPVDQCDVCGATLDSYRGRVTLAGVGQFCGRDCADIGSLRHELRMTARFRRMA